MRLGGEGLGALRAHLYAFLKRRPARLANYRRMAESVPERMSQGKVLDVGTGPGYLACEIARALPDSEVVGIDITPIFVKLASEYAGQERLDSRVKFVEGTAESMPFEDDTFDFIVSTASLHHWENPVAILNEIRRVLKPNGEAWIGDLRWDLDSQEVLVEFRKQRGWFLASIGRVLMPLLKRHCLTKEEIDRILSSEQLNFKNWTIDVGEFDFRVFVLKFTG